VDGRDQAGQPTRVMTIPNLLSVLRLCLLPVFLWLVLGPEADGPAVAVLMFMGISDYLDGFLARKLDQASPLGAILDPVADRLYILVTVVGLGARGIIPVWLAVILPARDVLLWVLVPFLRSRGFNALPVHFLGKAATAALLYAFPLLLLGDGQSAFEVGCRVLGWAFAIWGVGMYWWAGLLYAWQVRTLLGSTERKVPVGDG
jgi:cardiolipin synthase (CMP-forming)